MSAFIHLGYFISVASLSVEEDEPSQASDTTVTEEAEENCASENDHFDIVSYFIE